MRKRSSFRCKNKLRNRQPPQNFRKGKSCGGFLFCDLLDTSACEKYTNILVYIWKQKTECARKTTDFRGHLAKIGRFDKITTKEKCTEKLPEHSEKQEESDA